MFKKFKNKKYVKISKYKISIQTDPNLEQLSIIDKINAEHLNKA